MHAICPPENDVSLMRTVVIIPGQDMHYFDAPDLPSLLEALNYGGTFPHARYRALEFLMNIIKRYKEHIWRTSGDDSSPIESCSRMRIEVVRMIKLCCRQEANLLDAIWKALELEILKHKTDEAHSI